MTSTCPFCQDEIHMEQAWSDNDYSSVFETICPTCGRPVSVVVNLNPEFYLHEPN